MLLMIGMESSPLESNIAMPERRLLTDVINLAMLDVKGKRKERQDAIDFFLDLTSPFYEYCAYLGLDARMIANQVIYRD